MNVVNFCTCCIAAVVIFSETIQALTLEANVGNFFIYPVQRQSFFPESALVGEAQPVEFHSFTSGEADLPEWLGLWHQGDTTDAYLYGTPVSSDQERLNIQIIGYNKKTFQAVKHGVHIEVHQSPVLTGYVLDLPLLNISMTELLENDNIKQLRTIVNRWSRGEVLINRVTSPRLDWLNPGFTVRFASNKHFSSQLKSIDSKADEVACMRRPKSGLDAEFSPRFTVDWCSIQLVYLDLNKELDTSAQASSHGREVFTSIQYEPPEWSTGRRHSLFADFLACVLVPAGVLLLLVFVLVCLFCCGRMGMEQRVRMTPEPQLVRYNSIRRASISLRQLSENRELNLSSRSISMQGTGTDGGLSPGETSDGSRSAPGTLQRKRESSPRAPPPYRPPPAYSSDEEVVTNRPTEPGSDESETVPQRPSTTGRPRKTRGKGHTPADGSYTK